MLVVVPRHSGDKLGIKLVGFGPLADGAGKAFDVNRVGDHERKISVSTGKNKGHF